MFFTLESRFLQDVPESLANAPIREPRSHESIAAQQRAKVSPFLLRFTFFLCVDIHVAHLIDLFVSCCRSLQIVFYPVILELNLVPDENP